MADDVRMAEKLKVEAEGLLKERGWFIFKEGPKYSEASELFLRAGNIYKAAKEPTEAAACFLRAASCDEEAGEPDEGARKLVAAATCLKRNDPEQAVEVLKRAVQVFLRTGRFHVAATHEKEIAEIYETQIGALPEAISYYRTAADRYAGEDSTATAARFRLKAAELSGLTGEYEDAIEGYEEAARESLANPITRYSVKEYWLRAALCRLCMGDPIGAQQSMERYILEDGSFAKTREHKLLLGIIDAMQEDNLEKFTAEVIEYERVGLLDDWKTKMLVRIKQSINEEPDLT